MATLKPFCAIYPDPFYAETLVFSGNDQILSFGTEKIALPLLSLTEQLETPARKLPEKEKIQQQAYQLIISNLRKLLELGQLQIEEYPGIYVYQIIHPGYRQTGIWALTDICDFTNGKIKVHELTLADTEQQIRTYREKTGIEGSPVLLTYKPSLAINNSIDETCAKTKKTTFADKNNLHHIWKIEDPSALQTLTNAFKEIGNVYVADGHHRLAGTASLPCEKGSTFFSSLYVATDQLRIREYYRIIIPDTWVDGDLLLEKLQILFTVRLSKDNLPVSPKKGNIFGMYLNGKWFELEASLSGETNVLLLQRIVLAPLFGITDPRTDTRLQCIGGEFAMEETQHVLNRIPNAIAFTLSPLTVEEFITVSEIGTILPPKSTWIDPKVPYGLMLVQHSIQTT